jgi:hypothetical protein
VQHKAGVEHLPQESPAGQLQVVKEDYVKNRFFLAAATPPMLILVQPFMANPALSGRSC